MIHALKISKIPNFYSNVATRSIWDQCKKYPILRTDRRPATDDRPTDLSFGQYWGNFKWQCLREGSSDPLYVWFYGGVFGIGGSNGAILGFAKSKMAARPQPPSWKISNGDISAADRPIYSVFGSRMGFSGSADRMALIPFWPNSIGMWEKTMREEQLDWSTVKYFLLWYLPEKLTKFPNFTWSVPEKYPNFT